MQTQQRFWGHAATATKQPQLFDEADAPDSDLGCSECGSLMRLTPSGYLCCPKGHGRLHLADAPGLEPSGRWSDDDEA